jgi:membrane protein DedA with SNARE-associated domain
MFNRERNMDDFSFWNGITLVIWVAVFLVPAWKIAKKAGFHGAWSLLMLLPLVNIVMLWVFAFVRWPNLRDPGDREQSPAAQ